MRYPIIMIVLCLLALVAMPLQERDREKRTPVIDHVLPSEQQQAVMAWVDGRVNQLRALPPLHQALAMTTGIILLLSAAVILAYLINSLAAAVNMGFSLGMLAIFALLALTGLRRCKQALANYVKSHAEFGPIARRYHTKLWQKRYDRAAREYGLNSFSS